MTDPRSIANLGRGGKLILAGVGPHTPPSGVFSHIQVQSGAFKAREKGVDPAVNAGHLSADGTYSGSTYAFIPGTYSGNFDQVTGDAGFIAIAHYSAATP